MAFYSLADGGNQWANPGDPISSDVQGYVNIRPAAHHVDRIKSIEKHINTGALPFVGLEGTHIAIENGDSFATHLVGAPALLTGFSIHFRNVPDISVGSAQEGWTYTLTATIRNQSGTVVPVRIVDAAVGTIGGDSVAIPMAKGAKFFHVLPLVGDFAGVLNEDEVWRLEFTYAVTSDDVPAPATLPAMQACFGVVAYYTWLEDDGECNCVSVPCPATYPDPVCVPRP